MKFFENAKSQKNFYIPSTSNICSSYHFLQVLFFYDTTVAFHNENHSHKALNLLDVFVVHTKYIIEIVEISVSHLKIFVLCQEMNSSHRKRYIQLTTSFSSFTDVTKNKREINKMNQNKPGELYACNPLYHD